MFLQYNVFANYIYVTTRYALTKHIAILVEVYYNSPQFTTNCS